MAPTSRKPASYMARRDYERFQATGIEFVRLPKTEAYGSVAMFKDFYGNLWDLLQPTWLRDRMGIEITMWGYFFLNSNSSTTLFDGSQTRMARPAPPSLIAPLNWASALRSRSTSLSKSSVTIMKRFQPPGSGAPPACPPLPAPGALR